MKNIIVKAAVLACFLGPVLASAGDNNNAIKSITYKGGSFSDTYTFDVTSGTGHYDATIGATWSDMLLGKTAYDASSLGWTLTSGSGKKAVQVSNGSFIDDASQATGNETIALSNLSYGTRYTLKLTGTWSDVTLSGAGDSRIKKTPASVNLIDGDRIGPGAGYEPNSFSLIAMPVPEPESYALMLAGLGMVGTIVLRRARANSA